MKIGDYNETKLRQELHEGLEELKKLTLAIYQIQNSIDNMNLKYIKLLEEQIKNE